MKIIQLEQNEIETKNVEFEGIVFSCAKKFKYLVLEKIAEQDFLYSVMIFKNKPSLSTDEDGVEYYEDHEGEEFSELGLVSLSDETQERIDMLANNIHLI